MNSAPSFPNKSQIGELTGRSGVVYLRNGVASYFEENSIPAVVTPVGLRYRSFTINQSMPSNANRVTFIPGTFDGSNSLKPRSYGSLSNANYNSSSVVNPRELLSWERPITLSIWAAPVPGSNESVDRSERSIEIVEDLLEQVVRAVQVYAAASIQWADVVVNEPPTESAFGAELLVSLIQVGPIFDVTRDIAYPQGSMPRGNVHVT